MTEADKPIVPAMTADAGPLEAMASTDQPADQTKALLPVTPEAEEYDAAGYTRNMRELLDSLGGYQNVFNAIADATSVYAEGVGVNIGVRAFIRSITPHRIPHSLPGDGMREALIERATSLEAEAKARPFNSAMLTYAAGELRKVAALTPSPCPGDVGIALPRLDDGLIEAALIAHYGKGTAGINGLDLTANDVNWTFRDGFKRMWAGVRKELRRRAALTPSALSGDAGEREAKVVLLERYLRRARRVIGSKPSKIADDIDAYFAAHQGAE